MLTKAVLCAGDNGAFKLVEVPFSWQPGEPIPPGATEYSFPTAAEALAALANRGRKQSGVRAPAPLSSKQSPEADTPKPSEREQYREFVARATRWRDLPPSP